MKNFLIALVLTSTNLGFAQTLADLPKDLQILILKDSSIEDIMSYCRISTQVNKLCDVVWKIMAQRHFPLSQTENAQGLPWKTVYERALKENSFSVGFSHVCAIDKDQKAQCWGSNSSKQADVPEDLGKVRSIYAGGAISCAIKTNRLGRCWGRDAKSVPKDFGPVKAVSASMLHVCAIKLDDTVECWQLSARSAVPSTLKPVKAITTGAYTNTCALTSDNKAHCFGEIAEGIKEIPNTNTIALHPIFAGVCAVGLDGVSRWWNNKPGNIPVPLTFLNGLNVKAISFGRNHACAMTRSGPLCWGGTNQHGENNLPAGIGTVRGIGAGDGFTCVAKEDNRIYCWGNNESGQTDVPTDFLIAPDFNRGPDQDLTHFTRKHSYCGHRVRESDTKPGHFVLAVNFRAGIRKWFLTEIIDFPNEVQKFIKRQVGLCDEAENNYRKQLESTP